MHAADIVAFQGPLAVTLAYVLVYYGFQINVLRVKTARAAHYKSQGEQFDRYFGQDREMLAADRIQLNVLEHMGPFLVLLWLHAVFVDTSAATEAGGVYVASRALYPWMMGGRLGRRVPARIMVATGLGYAVLIYLAGAIVVAMLNAS